jgi:hypothetical protein
MKTRRGKIMIKTVLLLTISIGMVMTTQNVMGKLNILGETTSWFNDDTFNIAGEIRNNGSRDVDFVKVSATLYNVDGAVIGSDFTYTDPSTIPAGSTGPFQFRITDYHVRDVGEIETYKLTVSGD